MLRIVLGNLVQNAVQYAEGSISVAIHPDSIAISNGLALVDNQLHESGLGLEIIQRVCDRLGWHFSAGRREGEFAARLTLDSTEKREEAFT